MKYSALDHARDSAIVMVNRAAGVARTKYATDIPFQSDAYKAKLADCERFKADGYPESQLANYLYVNARATRRAVTGKLAADEIIATAMLWNTKLFAIEDLRDATIEAINAETDWAKCASIADAAVAKLEAM